MKFEVGDKIRFDRSLIPDIECEHPYVIEGLSHRYLTISKIDHIQNHYFLEELRGRWDGCYWTKVAVVPEVTLDEDLFEI